MVRISVRIVNLRFERLTLMSPALRGFLAQRPVRCRVMQLHGVVSLRVSAEMVTAAAGRRNRA